MRRVAAIQHNVLASSIPVRRAATEDEKPVRELGQQLFKALIADDVRILYEDSKRRARENGGGLRLVLRVRPPELARLPWEFLFDPGGQDYLGLEVPLVRALDRGEEQQRLQAALASLQRDGLVELERVAGQTYRDLEDTLDKGPWHVFHFVGHGGRLPIQNVTLVNLAEELEQLPDIRSELQGRSLGPPQKITPGCQAIRRPFVGQRP